MLFVITITTSCSKDPIVIDKPIDIYMPVKCQKAKMPICNFNKSTYTEISAAMVNCIGQLKIELRKCL